MNPAVGIALQLFASINHGDAAILFDIVGIVLGSILGGILAALFYDYFFEPLLNEVENK